MKTQLCSPQQASQAADNICGLLPHYTSSSCSTWQQFPNESSKKQQQNKNAIHFTTQKKGEKPC